MKKSDAMALATRLISEHASGERFVPFSRESGLEAVSDAYDVQDQFVERLLVHHGDVVGYKIGLTSIPMQTFCGIDQPIGGAVLSKRVLKSGVKVKASDFGRLGLEFEIAVRIGVSTAIDGTPYSAETIAPHVDAVCAAIELVDDRAADYKKLDVLSLIADNSWNGGAVLSEFKSGWPDLEQVSGAVWQGSATIDKGRGGDVLGHPFNALAWLANHLSSRGRNLEAGQIVLTGSLVKTIFPAQDAAYRFDLEGIGSVQLEVLTSNP